MPKTADRTTELKAGVARVFAQQPHRIAAAWRRMRHVERRGEAPALGLLDGLVEDFVREVGLGFEGNEVDAWSRTRGVLRLSTERGARGIHEEFASLRRCLVDAVEVLGGGDEERARVNRVVDEAVDSAVALYERMVDPAAPAPRQPFGGLVVEHFERTESSRKVKPGAEGGRAPVH
ncbi:hypothetical protein P2318_20655 [Myxococcaceae bacterium GXIMD 01537]